MGNILVTGGTGFVGSQVTKALVESGHNVSLVSRSATSSLQGLEVRHTEDLFSADTAELKSLLAAVDSVVHLAWHVDPNDYIFSEENWRCFSGSVSLALVARELGVKHFVGIGTCIEYEKTDAVRTPSTPLDPDTPYGAAKASLFFALREIFRKSLTEFAWCRLFFLHGEGEHPERLVPYIRSQIAEGKKPHLRNPSAVRDYLDVRDAGIKIAKVVDLRLSGAFNVCSGLAISLEDLSVKIAQEMGRMELAEELAKSDPKREGAVSDRVVGLPAPELEGV